MCGAGIDADDGLPDSELEAVQRRHHRDGNRSEGGIRAKPGIAQRRGPNRRRSGGLQAELKDLEAKWKPTREALSALVEYSDSLAAVAEAGKKGPETMAQLTGAITDLAKAVSITAIPAVGVEVVNRVGAKIIEIQAARDIRKAVGAAGDAIEIIAPILKATFVDRAISTAPPAGLTPRAFRLNRQSSPTITSRCRGIRNGSNIS